MTRQRSFKRLVRARMGTTGESYTTARTMLLAAVDVAAGDDKPPLATSDEAIRGRTGRGWEEWFDLLDGWGADAQPHKAIAGRVADKLGIHPLAWNAQAITVSYERARGLRVVGQRATGFAVTASKTIAVPMDRLYDAFVNDSQRRRWLPDGRLRQRTGTKPATARFDWADSKSRVNVYFEAKGEAKSTATVEHARLGDAEEAERMKAYWRTALRALKSQIETGNHDG